MTIPNNHVMEDIVLANWARDVERSALQEMLTSASAPGILSFALGLPAKEFFPAQAFSIAMSHTLANDAYALQYAPPLQKLKEQIVDLMCERGVQCSPEQILLTAGAQQGMNLLTRLLLNPGGKVLIEDLVYPGFRQVIDSYQPHILTVPTNSEVGIDVDKVEHILAGGDRPAFIYTVTDGHNPLSISLSMEKRLRLVQLAREFGVPIIEDDAYGFLFYDDTTQAPMRAFEQEFVFYLGSFSKILAPALRTGWIIAPEHLISKLSIVKEASDIDTTTFNQRAISTFLEMESFPSHLTYLRNEYRMRRDAMLSALERYFPIGCQWKKPVNGIFIWVEVPETVNTCDLFETAIKNERVAFIPGQAFQVNNGNGVSNAMRLNFSNCAVTEIEEGVSRLARALKRLLK